MTTLRIGTRGSPLAMWQAHHVSDLLRQAHPDLQIELVEIQTTGDQIRDIPLAQLGGQGVFTKAIQQALLDNTADVAVHSLKDLPTLPVEPLILAAVPKRGSTGDAFISHKHSSFDEIPHGATLATSSLRRKSQLLHRRPDLGIVDIRGNVETRLRKLEEEDLDGILLAEAGLQRLGLDNHITEVLSPEWMLPAVGQGALGLESRADDDRTKQFLAAIDDVETHHAVLAERAMLRRLQGGCHVPIGVRTEHRDDLLWIKGVVLSPDGTKRIEAENSGPPKNAEKLGDELADQLLQLGAKGLLEGTSNSEPRT